MSILISHKILFNDLLEFNKAKVIDALAKLDGSFSKVRNAGLRTLFAKRATITDAYKISGRTIPDFTDRKKQIKFIADDGRIISKS
ncbi:MAG: hypothetical protein ABI308_02185 [Mucilaginibacter sp.]